MPVCLLSVKPGWMPNLLSAPVRQAFDTLRRPPRGIFPVPFAALQDIAFHCADQAGGTQKMIPGGPGRVRRRLRCASSSAGRTADWGELDAYTSPITALPLGLSRLASTCATTTTPLASGGIRPFRLERYHWLLDCALGAMTGAVISG